VNSTSDDFSYLRSSRILCIYSCTLDRRHTYVGVYIYYTHIHVYVYILYAYTCIRIYMYTHIYVNVYICIRIYVYAYIYVSRMRPDACAWDPSWGPSTHACTRGAGGSVDIRLACNKANNGIVLHRVAPHSLQIPQPIRQWQL